jgi:hypothetical protein
MDNMSPSGCTIAVSSPPVQPERNGKISEDIAVQNDMFMKKASNSIQKGQYTEVYIHSPIL